MRQPLILMLALSACVANGGCAGLTHYNTTKLAGRPDGLPQAVLMDAKQRAILSSTPETKRTYTWNAASQRYDKAVIEVGPSRVCAEPSPDALSALAASNALSLSKGPDLGINEAMSLAESAGSIGLRTQSIQLMRDAMYRLCEGRMSGALTDASFETLHRRLQSSMVAILAIEQLTGAVKAKQIILGAAASTGGSADATQKLTEKTAEAAEAVTGAEKALATSKSEQASAKEALATAKAAFAAATDDESKKAATAKVEEAQTKLTAKDKAVSDAQTKLDNATTAHQVIDQGRRAALGGSTTASSDGVFETGTPAELDPESVKAVASAVQAIVASTLDLQYSNELCTTIMLGSRSAGGSPESTKAVALTAKTSGDVDVTTVCANLLLRTAEGLDAQTRAMASTAAAYNAAIARIPAADLVKLFLTQTTKDGATTTTPSLPKPNGGPHFKLMAPMIN